MTYFNFLLLFLVIPIGILSLLMMRDRRQGKPAAGFLDGRAFWLAVGLHVLLAVVYTTPWDNYLVATGVWYYDPELISGIVLGWVPLEEYIFFVLETILVSLWWFLLVRRVKPDGEFVPTKNIRIAATAVLAAVWLSSAAVLISGWKPGTYLSLILVWALPPIMLQLAFGADILWYFRKLVLFVILPVFLYISTTDTLAISSGTWTIDPAQSLGLMIGALPVEEAVFFLVTVTLIGFGMTLSLARISQARWLIWVDQLRKIHPRAALAKNSIEE